MRNLFPKFMTSAALVASSFVAVASPADATTRRHHRHHYYGSTAYRYRHCRYSSGSTGLLAGGVAGAVAGPSIVGHGLLGAAAGAVGGAIAGRAVDRTITARHRCYR